MDNNTSGNKNNLYNILIAKKTEKIVTAIYLISQFIQDEESLKFEIRNVSNSLLKDMNLIAYYKEGSLNKNIISLYESTLSYVSILISYLFVAKNSNLISKMNADIVIEGLRSLENILIEKQFSLTRDDLKIQEEAIFENLLSKKINTTDDVYEYTSYDVLNNRNIISENNTNTSSKNKQSEIKNIEKDTEEKIEKVKTIKDNTADIKDKNINPKRQNENIVISKDNKSIKNQKSEKTKQRKNNRKEQIISLFSKGVEVSINDISKKIIGCSTKTIQRELNDLLSENKIKRIGDKRWSKYLLV